MHSQRTVEKYWQLSSSSKQYFTGNPLDRSVLAGDKRDVELMSRILAESSTRCLVSAQARTIGPQRMLLVHSSSASSNVIELSSLSVEELLQMTGFTSPSDLLEKREILLLGKSKEGCWFILFDASISNHFTVEEVISFVSGLRDGVCLKYQFKDAWSLLHDGFLNQLSLDSVALAGQAVSITSWHDSNRYNGRSGSTTISVECGGKRATCGSASEKIYPRTDPVAICLVLSPNGKSILLGNMKRGKSSFYSCLSGFIDQCESVQEAVQREVLEESGISLKSNSIRIVDSQPWPLGRGGMCELMIGCIAEASTYNIEIHDSDVADVRWFQRDQINQLLDNIDESSSRKKSPDELAWLNTDLIKIPGEYAIAYHLIRSFAETNVNESCRKPSLYECFKPSAVKLVLIPVLMFLCRN